jgi:hypothetical protein
VDILYLDFPDLVYIDIRNQHCKNLLLFYNLLYNSYIFLYRQRYKDPNHNP